jgi:hypothetical protein
MAALIETKIPVGCESAAPLEKIMFASTLWVIDCSAALASPLGLIECTSRIF